MRTDGQRLTYIHTHTYRQKGKRGDRKNQTDTDRYVNGRTDRPMDRKTDRQACRRTSRQTDIYIPTDRQSYKLTGIWREGQTSGLMD